MATGATENACGSVMAALGELRFLQLNGQKGYGVMCDLGECLVSECIDICMLQEPYVVNGCVRGLPSGWRVYVSRSGRAALVVCSDSIESMVIDDWGCENGVCAWVKGSFGAMYVVSLYCRWGEDIEPYLHNLDSLLGRLNGCEIVIGMDANATSGLWFSKDITPHDERDNRGRMIEEWLACNEWGLNVLNVPSVHYTFSGARGESDIDVTLSNIGRDDCRFEWEILNECGISDHSPILIRLWHGVNDDDASRCLPQNKWCDRKTDWTRYLNVLSDCAEELGFESFSNLSSDAMVNVLSEWISRANNECMEKVRMVKKRKIAWWTDELNRMKGRVRRQRKQYQSARRRMDESAVEKWNAWRNSMKEYKRMMKVAKEGNWRDFVGREGNGDPWGTVYKICRYDKGREVLAGLRTENGCTKTWMESVNVLMAEFFPRSDEARPICVNEVCDSHSEFEWAEIDAAVKRLRRRKSPGLDGITNVMIKCAWYAIPMYVKCMYDACLREGSFPSVWKEARVVALLKGVDKDRKEPRSYRPISLLNGLGKILERMMTERLLRKMNGKWNERQYGFTFERSTEDAWLKVKESVAEVQEKYAMGILVDFKGAFDYLRWSEIIECLRECGCTGNELLLWMDYFRGRKACMRSRVDEKWVNVERGCPQGSVPGPYVWNLCMNGLLNSLCEVNERVAAYADDLIIVVHGNSRMELERMGEECMKIVYEWGERAGVSVNDGKTVCMMLKGRMNVVNRNLRVNLGPCGTRHIRYVSSVKYLGVQMCERMRLGVHVRSLREKLMNALGCLRRVLRKEWGVRKNVACMWMNGLFMACALYGASAWYELMKQQGMKDELNRCQRCVMYACARVCRTVSTEAMQVLLGWPPWDLLCIQRANVFKAKRGLRMNELDLVNDVEIDGMNLSEVRELLNVRVTEAWQRRWDESRKGRVTYEFVSDVKYASERKWFEPSLRVGYILTGHGTLNGWLYERSLADSPACPCGAPVEDWMHVLCRCEMYESFRDLNGMGVTELLDGSFNVRPVLSVREQYECMCTFIERAYRMRASVLGRMNELHEE